MTSSRGVVLLEGHHVDPGHHDLPDRRVVEIEDAADHLPLVSIQIHLLVVVVDEAADLARGQQGLGLGTAHSVSSRRSMISQQERDPGPQHQRQRPGDHADNPHVAQGRAQGHHLEQDGAEGPGQHHQNGIYGVEPEAHAADPGLGQQLTAGQHPQHGGHQIEVAHRHLVATQIAADRRAPPPPAATPPAVRCGGARRAAGSPTGGRP